MLPGPPAADLSASLSKGDSLSRAITMLERFEDQYPDAMRMFMDEVSQQQQQSRRQGQHQKGTAG